MQVQAGHRYTVRWHDVERQVEVKAVRSIVSDASLDHNIQPRGGAGALSTTTTAVSVAREGLKQEAYVHFINSDSRLDEWLPVDNFIRHVADQQTEEGAAGATALDEEASEGQAGATATTAGDASMQAAAVDGTPGAATGPLASTSLKRKRERDTESPSFVSKLTAEGDNPTTALQPKRITSVIFGSYEIKCWYSSPYPIEDLLEAASSVNVPTSSSGSKHPKSTSSSASHKASAQSSPRNASAASTSTNPTASKIRLASGRFAPRSKAPTATTPAKSPLAQAETATSDNEPSSTTRSSIKTEEHESQHGLPPTASGSDASLQNAFDGIQPQSNQAGKETGVADATLSRETTATAPDTSIAAAAQSSQQASEEQTAGDVQPPLQEATTAVAAPVEEPKAVPAVPGAVHRSARAVVGKALSSKGTVPLPVAASSRAISPQTPIAPTKKDKLVTTTKLYVCEGCFKYMVHAPSYSLHRRTCDRRGPPGKKVYERGPHAIWKIDGEKDKLYCQNLCLFGKLFIDHKYVFFETSGFDFYVITESRPSFHHVLGFFSKEKVSCSDYNLACIVTFPPYQHRGFGTLLIEYSYEISSKQPGKQAGTPERPLSDLGLRGYLQYWTSVLVRYFRLIFYTRNDPRLVAIDQMGTMTTAAVPPNLQAMNGTAKSAGPSTYKGLDSRTDTPMPSKDPHAPASPMATSRDSTSDPTSPHRSMSSSSTPAQTRAAGEVRQTRSRAADHDGPAKANLQTASPSTSGTDKSQSITTNGHGDAAEDANGVPMPAPFSMSFSLAEIANATHLRPDDVALALVYSGLAKLRIPAAPEHVSVPDAQQRAQQNILATGSLPDGLNEEDMEIVITPAVIEEVAKKFKVRAKLLKANHMIPEEV